MQSGNESPTREPVKRQSSLGCLYLFVAPFCAAGIVCTILAARELFLGTPDGGKLAGLGLCGLLLAGGGFGFLVFGLRAYKRETRERGRLAQYPDAPWMWKEAWASGRIRCSGKSTMATAWGLCLFTNLVSSPIFVALPEELDKENYLALLALVFPLLGAGFLVWAVRVTLRWRKFGSSVFEMDSVPGVVGGRLSGTVLTRTRLEPEDGFQVCLTCFHRVVRGSGKSRSVREKVLWRQEGTVECPPLWGAGEGGLIPVDFRVPFSCRETDERDPDSKIIWRLELRAEVLGIDYKSVFEVPVFKTAESTDDPGPRRAPQEDLDYADLYRDAGIDVLRTPSGGLEIVYPAARNRGVAVSMTLFTLIWTGALWLQLHLGAPFIFPLVTGLVEILLMLITLELWCGRSTVRVDSTRVSVRSTILGIGWTKFASIEKIESVSTRIGMQSGSTPYYDVVVAHKGDRFPGASRVLDKTLLAGRHLRDKKLAQWLAAQIEDVLTAADVAGDPRTFKARGRALPSTTP